MENYELKQNETQFNKRKMVVLMGFMLVFLVAFLLVSIFYNSAASNSNTYAIALENSYKKSFFELLDNVKDIETNLNKSLVSNNESLQENYMQLACDNCKYAQNNFSTLPISINTVEDGVKFINQIDGYVSSLIRQDGSLTTDQKDKIRELLEIIAELKTAVNDIVIDLQEGYSILGNSIPDSEGLTDFSSSFEGWSSDSISYPSMIFDGPFSDSLFDKDINGLPETEVTETQARTVVDTALADYGIVNVIYSGETNGNFVTYDYELYTNDQTYFAQVTKRGGFLLTLSSYASESETVTNDIDECIVISTDFATSLGITDMEEVWNETKLGIAFINLAPVINGITYYPDLIKVKVDMNTGLIIGWEAQNYAYNHITRTNTTASVGATEARDLLDLALNIVSQKLCIIPLDYGGEVLSYEFECEYYGSTYYVYINAINGVEEKVMQVVTTDEGELLV